MDSSEVLNIFRIQKRNLVKIPESEFIYFSMESRVIRRVQYRREQELLKLFFDVTSVNWIPLPYPDP